MADWKPVRGAEKHALQMTCQAGTYHVSKGQSMGRLRYLAWPPKPPEQPVGGEYRWEDYTHSALGCFDTADAAKARCEVHAGLR